MFSGEGNGNPLQYFCLGNPMDGGGWWAVVHGIVKSRTRLSDFTFTFHFHALEKAMHSSILAWRIPGTGESGGLPSMGSHRVRHDWIDLAAAATLACSMTRSLLCWLCDKESVCQCRSPRDADSIPGSGRSPGGGNVNPLQNSCLDNPTDGGAWCAIIHRVAKSRTWLTKHGCPRYRVNYKF